MPTGEAIQERVNTEYFLRDEMESKMNELDRPTWQLILIAVKKLDADGGFFRSDEVIKEVQLLDPRRGLTSIRPVLQGMTSNAGKGPLSPCGKPLIRVSHGIYRLSGEVQEIEPRSANVHLKPRSLRIRSSNQRGQGEVENRVAELIGDFAASLEGYDRQVPFRRSGQYSLHRETIDIRRSFSTVRDAIEDEEFLDYFHKTLYAWGIGKRASRLVPLAQFGNRLRSCSDEIATFEHLRLDDPGIDITATAVRLWNLIERLEIVNNVSLIVPGTKTLHHLLPDLVPPMDRAWTGAFFLWSMGAPQYEQSTFVQTFSSFAKIAQATNPSSYVGDEWRTSITKVLDNSIIGYCKLHGIEARGS